MKTEHIMIVRVHMNHVKHVLKKKDGIYKDLGIKTASNLESLYNRAQALDFEGTIMSYVITHIKETTSAYNVMFEGQAFSLSKSNLDDRWYRFNEVFEFRLCKTAKDAWRALRGYYFELHEKVQKMIDATPTGDWEPVENKGEKNKKEGI